MLKEILMRLGLLVALALLVTACAHVLAAPNRMPPRPASFEELLASGENDVVVDGTVLMASEEPHRYTTEDACGYKGLSSRPSTKITLRVTRVRYGVIEDSVITASVLEQGFGYLIGRQVRLWAYRERCDGWNLNGYMGVLESDGMITHGNGRPIYRNRSGAMEKVPDARLEASRLRHSSSLYDQTGAIAIARLTGWGEWNDARGLYEYPVEIVGWALGQGTLDVDRISFPEQPDCYPRIFEGDSLLVPVPPGGVRGRNVNLALCPSALRIKGGHVPGLGVVLADVGRALDRVGDQYRLRAVLRRGQ